MAGSSSNRDPNEVMKTILNVIEEYDGFIMGVGSKNDYATFNQVGDTPLSEKVPSMINHDQAAIAQHITDMRRSFFTTLLDSAVGAYYTTDIVNGKGIFDSENRTADLENLSEHIVILADESIHNAKSNVENTLLTNEDAKNPLSAKNSGELASMRKMIREYSYVSKSKSDLMNLRSPTSEETENMEDAINSDPETFTSVLTQKQKDQQLVEFTVPTELTEIVNKEGFLSTPSLTDKKMSAFVIKNSEFNYGKRRVEFLSLFFNGITPIEMSRCTPYIEITFHHQNFGSHSEHYLNPTAYMKFFSTNKDGSGRQELAGFAGKTHPINEKESNLYNADNGYMNIFTSPQTMVNANINSEPSPVGLGDWKANSYNKALDPFAPQATLNSLTLSTTSGGHGFTSQKKGSMIITIHDRSRLKEFAPIISINQLAKTKVKITYGWSHPDGRVDSDNPLGRFLDSMKSSQHFSLVSSNLRFQGNSIEAALELFSMGNQHLQDVSSAAGVHIPMRSVGSAIESVVSSLIEKEKQKINPTISSDKIAYVHPQLELLVATANSVETMVSAADYEAFQIKLKANVGGDLDTEVVMLAGKILGIDALAEGFEVFKERLKAEKGKDTETPGQKNSAIAKLVSDTNKISTAKILRQKYETLFATAVGEDGVARQVQPDYFTENCLVTGAKRFATDDKGKQYEYTDDIVRDTSYVSFGKCIANFVAAPLIATGEYSEVQMFFYPLNSAAGGARKYTTASLPIKKDELATIFDAKPETDEDGNTDEDAESIKLGTISTKGMFAKLAALTQSTDFDAYGLTSVGNIAKLAEVNAIFNEGNLTNLAEFTKKGYLTNYYSKFRKVAEEKIEETLELLKTATKEKQLATLKAAIAVVIDEKAKGKKASLLKQIYSNDGLGATDVNTFRFPSINMHLEVLSPIRPISEGKINLDIRAFGSESALYDESIQTEYDKGRILRIHITDQGNIGEAKVDLANQILFGGKKDLSDNQATAKILANGINNLSDAELKEYIKRQYATIIYGAGSSTVKSVNVSSTTSDRIAQAKMMTYEKNRRSKSISKNVNTVAESVRMVPASVDIQMLGCPLIERGSIIFIDMGTNTDLDNCYVVNSVTHSLSKGDFTTSLGLVVGNQGTIINARGSMIQKLSAIANASKELNTKQ